MFGLGGHVTHHPLNACEQAFAWEALFWADGVSGWWHEVKGQWWVTLYAHRTSEDGAAWCATRTAPTVTAAAELIERTFLHAEQARISAREQNQ